MTRAFASIMLGLGLTLACSASPDAQSPDAPVAGQPALGGAAGAPTSGGVGTTSGSSGDGTGGAVSPHPDPTTDLPTEPALPALGVNDVTILFPRPRLAQETSQLWSLADEGRYGALLPAAIYEANVFRLWSFDEPDPLGGYANSRVVAVRLDDCADAASAERCVAQIRLSTQPWAGLTQGFVTAGIQLIYEVEGRELRELVAALREADTRAGDEHRREPLGPHTLLVTQGLDGAFARVLRKEVLSYVGVKRLVKLRVLTAYDEGPTIGKSKWRFSEFERRDGAFVRSTIVGSAVDGGPERDVQVLLERAGSYAAARDTELSFRDQRLGYPTDFLRSADAKLLTTEKYAEGLTRLARLEDPRAVSSSAVDCASCHAANNREFFEQMRLTKADGGFAPPSGQNVQRQDETALSGRAVLGLGYLEGQLAISQRVINESALVAARLGRGASARSHE